MSYVTCAGIKYPFPQWVLNAHGLSEGADVGFSDLKALRATQEAGR